MAFERALIRASRQAFFAEEHRLGRASHLVIRISSGLEALRDGVARGEIGTVLVWSIDRLSRNFAHQILLQEALARCSAAFRCVQ